MRRFFRILVVLAIGALGFTLSYLLVLSPLYSRIFDDNNLWLSGGIVGASTLTLLVLGFFFSPMILKKMEQFIRWTEGRLQKMPVSDLIGGSIGLIIGLIIASLFGPALRGIPIAGRYLPILTSIILGYLGLSLGIKKREELLTLNPGRVFSGKEQKKKDLLTELSEMVKARSEQSGEKEDLGIKADGKSGCPFKILDTSAIIDGRIADVFQTGFVDGVIVVPKFVLTELQHIADSSDGLKRNRGRRGLDILNAMRKDMNSQIHIEDTDFPEVAEVDGKLVRLAQTMGGDILTTDFNLNKVAELQGVRVLNINDLVNALKPVYLPGEDMVVHVLKEGKEQRQGIGYLDDGTMIVVEMGRKYINQRIYTTVTSVLQTSAGRMIFVKPKYSDKRVFADENIED